MLRLPDRWKEILSYQHSALCAAAYLSDVPTTMKTPFRELMPLEGRDPRIDEALAVMLASRMSQVMVRPRKRRPNKLIAGVADSIAVIMAISLIFYHPRDNQTFAYVAGIKIHDTDEIKNIVATQLNDIGESSDLFSQTLSDDLDDIREALTADDI